LSHTDYTIPGTRAYRSSTEIYRSIVDYEAASDTGLNGFILLVHIGTAPERTDKFYMHLKDLLEELRSRGYEFKRIDELLSDKNLRSNES
jgi:peptidoglycan/xylan/chitin deacetylase (PgdA/CDA1 family)